MYQPLQTRKNTNVQTTPLTAVPGTGMHGLCQMQGQTAPTSSIRIRLFGHPAYEWRSRRRFHMVQKDDEILGGYGEKTQSKFTHYLIAKLLFSQIFYRWSPSARNWSKSQNKVIGINIVRWQMMWRIEMQKRSQSNWQLKSTDIPAPLCVDNQRYPGRCKRGPPRNAPQPHSIHRPR